MLLHVVVTGLLLVFTVCIFIVCVVMSDRNRVLKV
jgi:hypothetical protein